MAKKTLLSESQVSSFMKLANIKSEKISNFKKRLNESYTGLEGTGNMGEDEQAADAGPSDMGDDMGTGMEADEMDMEPEAPSNEADFEGGADDFKAVLRDALKEVLPQVMAELEGGDMGDEDEGDMDLDMDLASDEEMEDEGEVDEMDMEEEESDEEQEEEQELQEAKKKAMKADKKKTRNLEGGDAKKKMKESLAFDNVDLVTDDEIINEVLKRVIRRIV